MAARSRSPKAEKDLSERKRYWLKDIRAAERQGEPLKTYAKRLGLSEHSMYEAKRRLRAYGLIAPATHRHAAPSRFTWVAGEPIQTSPAISLRVRPASGARRRGAMHRLPYFLCHHRERSPTPTTT